MSCSSWRRREGNRWQPGMMVCHDSSVRMFWAVSQVGFMLSAISLAETATARCLCRQERWGGVVLPWTNSAKLSCSLETGTVRRAPGHRRAQAEEVQPAEVPQ